MAKDCALFMMSLNYATGTSHAGYAEVVKELLRQAETQCYKHERRLVWLQAVKPTFEVSAYCLCSTVKAVS